MKDLIPEVHLFIALDPKVSPGPILQALDFFRVKEWQQETVLVCDSSWKKYVNVDQAVIFMDKEQFYSGTSSQGTVNTDVLEQFLEQLDSFQISSPEFLDRCIAPSFHPCCRNRHLKFARTTDG